MAEIFFHKAVDMTLIDWFATFAPEPSEKDMNMERMQDKSRRFDNDAFIARSDMQIRCELRYRHAKAMMEARMR